MTEAVVPQHIAIIMDGNGRWAARRGRPRIFGHIRGAKRVREIVERAGERGVKALTLFAFSTENWTRPQGELDVLWKLLHKFIVREVDRLDTKGVRLRVIGEMERLNPDLQALLTHTMERLSQNTGLTLTLALSYGGRSDILRAVRSLVNDAANGRLKATDITEELLTRETAGGLPEVDLMIRTSGEKRISNFLLWHLAYAELFFADVCWPDFGTTEFEKALKDFEKRERRFGSV